MVDLASKTDQEAVGGSSAVHWLPVVGLLIGIPLLMAFVLSRWLGIPSEGIPSERILKSFELQLGEGSRFQGLEYSGLVFARVDLDERDLEVWARRLSSLPSREALVEEPISLKIDRPWWDPPPQTSGRLWEFPKGFLWRAEETPETCYLVVIDREGRERLER